jgi:hypothetical protein
MRTTSTPIPLVGRYDTRHAWTTYKHARKCALQRTSLGAALLCIGFLLVLIIEESKSQTFHGATAGDNGRAPGRRHLGEVYRLVTKRNFCGLTDAGFRVLQHGVPDQFFITCALLLKLTTAQCVVGRFISLSN